MASEWALTEVIDGAPLWTYIWCISSQFIVFPLVGHYCSVRTYKITFTILLLKDFLVGQLPTSLVLHHVFSILIINTFCLRKLDVQMYTAAEFGSAFFNLVTLARYYNIFVTPIFIMYSVMISLSNAYVLQYIYHYRAATVWKVVPVSIIVGRQAFIYL